MELSTKWGVRVYGKMLASAMSKADINYFYRRFTHALLYGGSDRDMWVCDVIQLERDVQVIQPFVDSAHFRSGVASLKNIAYTPKGARRETQKALEFKAGTLHTLDTATGIQWVGSMFMAGRYNPTFRVVSPTGWFRYANLPWQSGGYFEVGDYGP